MAGLYIHVPFCRQACRYCDYYFTVSLQYRENYVSALLKELSERKDNVNKNEIKSLYLGGGTPSVLTKEQLSKIVENAFRHYTISANAEITLEANPDDLTNDRINVYKSLGFNRLSIGIQSFQKEDLALMRRSHSVTQAHQSVLRARDCGIENISVDLIYGLPGLKNEKWKQNLETALSLPIQHISAYHLSYEKGTVFHHWLKKGKLIELPEMQSIEQYEILRKSTAASGFEHYEISNFSLPGFRSRHNLTYWNGDYYKGFGPSAHSYNGKERRWNISSLKRYIDLLEKEEIYFDRETLQFHDQINDYLITSLRVAEGLDCVYLKETFGEKYLGEVQKKAEKYLLMKDMILSGDRLKITPGGWLKSDMILSDLVFVSES